jgi:hypothetical protein
MSSPPSRGAAVALAVTLLVLAGCGSSRKLPVYDDEQGFHFTPPPGWSERARPGVGTAPAKPPGRRRPTDPPLPPLGVPGATAPERLLVRYDRLAAGRLGWLRVTTAAVPEALSLDACLSRRAPEPDWRREGNVEHLEVAGQPAARVAFAGRWSDQDYLSETVAVRKGVQVYFLSASFPASDRAARDEVRQAIAGATWR